MIDMKELLAFAVEQNASDIHIAVGIPPKLRINGRLTEVELPAMTPADAAEPNYVSDWTFNDALILVHDNSSILYACLLF